MVNQNRILSRHRNRKTESEPAVSKVVSKVEGSDSCSTLLILKFLNTIDLKYPHNALTAAQSSAVIVTLSGSLNLNMTASPAKGVAVPGALFLELYS